MNEMIERVGEKLREACLEEFGATWSYDVAWKFARVAIEAMREPTAAMAKPATEALILARAPEVDHYRKESRTKMADGDNVGAHFAAGVANGLGCGNVEELFAVYRAMITAALTNSQ